MEFLLFFKALILLLIVIIETKRFIVYLFIKQLICPALELFINDFRPIFKFTETSESMVNNH